MTNKNTTPNENVVLLPAFKLKGGSFYFLSALNSKWSFKAERIDKKDDEDIFGNKLKAVKGKGSVKCKPTHDSCLDSEIQIRLVPFPLMTKDSERYVLLSKKRFNNSQKTDTWKFVAQKLDASSARKHRPHEKGSGHGIGEAIGEKIVGIMPDKTWNISEFD